MSDFVFRDLNNEIRVLMVAEIEMDIRDDVLVPSKLFNDHGHSKYPHLILRAAQAFDERWLAGNLVGAFHECHPGTGRRVRSDQHVFFSQCEFNRFYVRAVCQFAIERPEFRARVYRARASENPRPESEALIGTFVVPEDVLRDLRTRLGTTPQFGVAQVSSGLSLELVEDGDSF
jgi:hypothetical protein